MLSDEQLVVTQTLGAVVRLRGTRNVTVTSKWKEQEVTCCLTERQHLHCSALVVRPSLPTDSLIPAPFPILTSNPFFFGEDSRKITSTRPKIPPLSVALRGTLFLFHPQVFLEAQWDVGGRGVLCRERICWSGLQGWQKHKDGCVLSFGSDRTFFLHQELTSNIHTRILIHTDETIVTLHRGTVWCDDYF